MKIYDFEGKKNISGERIHQARTAKRLTQAELAAQLQTRGIVVEREAVSKMETGDRFVTDYELRALSEIFGVTMDWMTTEDD